MRNARFLILAALAAQFLISNTNGASAQQIGTHILPQAKLATTQFGSDAPWYQANILFSTVPTPKSRKSITYFCLENVPYHGLSVTILYDCDGKHYHKGTGLSVYVNGRQVVAPSALGKKTVAIPPPVIVKTTRPIDLAVNMAAKGFPTPDASINTTPADLFQAVDGRVWFWPNVRNYWSNAGSQASRDWYSLDFGTEKSVRSVTLYFYSDGTQFQALANYTVQPWTGTDWADVPKTQKTPTVPLGNGENTVTFPSVATSKVRVVFTNPKAAAVALAEMKAF